MDNPLYPTGSIVDVLVSLFAVSIWLVFLGIIAFVSYRILRKHGFLTRLRQNLDGQAARTAYNNGLKDGDQRAQQRDELETVNEQISRLADAVNRFEQQLADKQRATARPSPQQVVDRKADTRKKTDQPTTDVGPVASKGSVLARDPSGSPAPAGTPSASRSARRLGLHQPRPRLVRDPAAINATATTSPPTTAPTSSS